MEHNHNSLIYGFLISFIIFGMGLTLGFLSTSGVDLQSKVILEVLGGLMIVVAIFILRRNFKIRDACPVCKEKYVYRGKNN